MSGALINLVRESVTTDVVDHDYTAGEPTEQHPEVKLETPDGDPCAIPPAPSYEDQDYRYNYITGDVGHLARLIARKLPLAIDYIGGGTWAALDRWRQERARVLVAPGFGRNTVFAYRPLRQAGANYADGGAAYDLTGNWPLTVAQSSSLLHWSFADRLFRPVSASNTAVFDLTPGGAGWMLTRSVRNLMLPTYPKGATEGHGATDCGWKKSGTDAADITLTHVPGGFGNSYCPDYLHVDVTNDVSVLSQRALVVQDVWDSTSGDYGGVTMTGTGTAVVCVWLRGQLPDGASLSFGLPGSSTLRDLSGANFDGWTPVVLSHYESDWSAGVPRLRLDLASAEGVACAFDIGPSMVCQSSGITYSAGAYWAPSSSFTGGEGLSVSNFDMPGSGTVLVSFYVPSWFLDSYLSSANCGLVGGDSFGLTIKRDTSSGVSVQIQGDDGGVVTLTVGSITLNAGAINTLAYTWHGDAFKLYVNGALVHTVDRTSINLGLGSFTTFHVGQDRVAHATDPLNLLTVRVDRGAMTAADVANNHLALTDPAALAFARAARGRVFRITGVPQAVRPSFEGSQILGNLTLEQVAYTPALADPYNREVSLS